jgi:HK97 family phage prohead protease
MEYKSRPAELKVSDDGLTIEGYASTFGGDPDSYGDIVDPGAFKKTIKERFPKGSIKMLWQHREPLGMPITLSEDSKGLQFEGRITDTQFGRDCLAYIRDGVVNTMSIGYSTIKHEIDDSGDDEIRHLKEVKLYEISPVTFPANENATITGVKAMIEKRFAQFEHLIIGDVKIPEDLDELDEKAGRILSAANIKITKNALKSLDECTSALNAMLEAAEPVSDDTTSGKEDVNPADSLGQLIELRKRIEKI